MKVQVEMGCNVKMSSLFEEGMGWVECWDGMRFAWDEGCIG